MPSSPFCSDHGSAKESLKSMQLPPGNNYNAKSSGWYKWHSNKRGELVSLPSFASGIFLPKEYQPIPRTAKDGGGAAHEVFQVQASGSQKLWAKETPAKPSTDIATPKNQGSKACWKPCHTQCSLAYIWDFLIPNLMIKRNMESKVFFMSNSVYTQSYGSRISLFSWIILNFKV